MTEPVKEGWYEDPAGRHEYRWFSAGAPTDLVKDAGTTSRDSISIADPALYQSMHLKQEPDVSPLLYKDDAPAPAFELVNFGQGPAGVVNTAGRTPAPGAFMESAGAIERVLVFLPVLVAWLLGRLLYLPLIAWLPLIFLSPLIVLLGRWRRKRRSRRFQRSATSH
jgi:hypothetical protein